MARKVKAEAVCSPSNNAAQRETKPDDSGSGLRELLAGSWRAVDGQRKPFFCFVALFVLAYSVELLVPWATGYTIGAFVEHGFSQQAFQIGLWGIGAFFFLRLTNIVCHHLGRYIQFSVAYSAKMEELNRVFGLILSRHLHWHTDGQSGGHSGESLAKLQRSATAVNNVVGQYSWQVIDGLVKVVLATLALATLDIVVSLNVLVTSAITIFVMVYFNRRIVGYLKVNYGFENKINRICIDVLSNIVTVKTLGLEPYATKHLRSQKDEGRDYARRISGFTELKWGTINLGYALVTASSLLLYFYRRSFEPTSLDVAQVYVLISYLDKIFAAISSFTGYYGGIVEAYTAYYDAAKSVSRPETLDSAGISSATVTAWKELSVRDISFSYQRGERGLARVNLDIKRGEKIALVGASGCGKSTLLRILGGTLVSQQGSVSVDGKKGGLVQLASGALLIPQEPQIFSDTLINNLTMGDEYTSDQLKEVIALCRLTEVVERLPEKWNTNLVANGLGLSGGEKQRVALARGLLRASRKQFLLLDEPTSSLDPKTELQLLCSVFERFRNTTVISSCHRWTLLSLFDKVVFMEQGKIIDVTSPDEFARRLAAKSQKSEELDWGSAVHFTNGSGVHANV